MFRIPSAEIFQGNSKPSRWSGDSQLTGNGSEAVKKLRVIELPVCKPLITSKDFLHFGRFFYFLTKLAI